MSDNIITLNSELIHTKLKDDSVNLLSVGESQRIPAHIRGADEVTRCIIGHAGGVAQLEWRLGMR